MIPISKITSLPVFHRATITAEQLDAMGHMNIRWYIAFYDDAIWNLFAALGLTQEYYRQEAQGDFALQQFIRYLAEVHAGESVAIHSRLLGRSAKRIHFMHFMVNETTAKLASTIEVLGIHMDLNARRSMPFPPPIAQQIDALIGEHSQLDWDAPVCGVIKP